MSYSVDPPQLLSVAERLRSCFDDLDELVESIRRATDAVTRSLTRAAPVDAAFADVADARLHLAHRILGRGRAAILALQSAAVAYLTADDEMAATIAANESGLPVLDERNPFDPTAFGARLL